MEAGPPCLVLHERWLDHAVGRTSGKWNRRTHAHQGISAVSNNTGSSFVLGIGDSSSSLRLSISASMTCKRAHTDRKMCVADVIVRSTSSSRMCGSKRTFSQAA